MRADRRRRPDAEPTKRATTSELGAAEPVEQRPVAVAVELDEPTHRRSWLRRATVHPSKQGRLTYVSPETLLVVPVVVVGTDRTDRTDRGPGSEPPSPTARDMSPGKPCWSHWS
jgi:hypothetical protein